MSLRQGGQQPFQRLMACLRVVSLRLVLRNFFAARVSGGALASRQSWRLAAITRRVARSAAGPSSRAADLRRAA